MTEVITSKSNERLKLVRRLHQRRHREREGLFVTEGEDLLEAGLEAGVEPVGLVTLQGEGLGGEEATADALASASTLGSGTRAIAIWKQSLASVAGPVCVYLQGVSDPGNVGAIVRTTHALVEGTVVLGPGCADPFSPKAVRATMGSIFGQLLARAGIEDTPEPRVALVARGGRPIDEMAPSWRISPIRRHPTALSTQPGSITLVLGSERTGLPPEVVEACDEQVTIPLRADGAESLNVAAAAAIALQRISSGAADG
jgi:RNA methyltransferase, TrmH family